MSGTGTHLAGPKEIPGPPPGSLADSHLVSPPKCWRRDMALIGSSLEIESELL